MDITFDIDLLSLVLMLYWLVGDYRRAIGWLNWLVKRYLEGPPA